MAPEHENERTEYKSVVNDSAIKTIVAFANISGGTLYIGMNDEGKPVGLDDANAEMTKLANMMRTNIKPDVLMMTSCEVEKVDGVDVIAVHVGRGVKRPYYLASKGLRPEGVYVRSGAAIVPSNDTAILRMVQETDGDAFETRRSFNQKLTFGYAASEFAKKNLAFGEGEIRTLGLLDAEGLYTNLGLILSDQCPPMVKSALFDDDDRGVFTAREEYSGSILKQLNDAYAFLDYNNHFRTRFEGLERIDYHDYPAVALREALVNSVAHREFALSGPTLVSVMPSKVEIVSLGGLPLGLEYPDLSAHVSMPRNRMFANVLFRLEIIEAYGTGIDRMRKSYAGSGLDIEINVTPNTFSVVLPNRNRASLPQGGETGLWDGAIGLLRSGAKTRQEIQDALEASQSTTIRLLGELVKQGQIVKVGQGRSTRYRLPR
ncbi:MAG: RNA-binding domain-containing protein [Coriobacteriia bacterium]